jgi:hypothetical protein
MAMINNLYPPIVPDTMPAFVRTNSCKIYFSLPVFNSLKDIEHNIQLSIVNQKTNQSALDITKYPSGIKIINSIGGPDVNVNGDYNYFVEIDPDDLMKTSSD